MASSTQYKYKKVCPDCDGSPFREIPNSGASLLWGLIRTPNKGIICKKCMGAGFILPKEIILAIDRFEPKKIIY